MIQKLIVTSAMCLFALVPTMAKEHLIERGETPASIAAMYGITEDKLFELNPIAKDMFYTGMVLIVPDGKAEVCKSIGDKLQDTNESPQTNDTYYADKTVSPVVPEVQSGSKGIHYDVTYDASQLHRGSEYKEKDMNSSRLEGFWGIFFESGSFEYAKETGVYGITFLLTPWKLAGNLCMGLDLSIGLNAGLVPKEFISCQIGLGPALSYYFTPDMFLSFPLDVRCAISTTKSEDNKDKYVTTWGMSLTPMFNFCKKVGIFVGPMLNIAFTEKSKLNCGFKVGLALNL